MLSWLSFEVLARGCSVPLLEQPVMSIPPATTLVGSYPTPLSTYLNHPRAWHQATTNSPYTPKLLKLFKLANSKPTFPHLTISYLGNHSKVSSQSFPHFPSALLMTPGDSQCGSLWCDVFSVLKSQSITSYLLNGSCLLICWPYHT